MNSKKVIIIIAIVALIILVVLSILLVTLMGKQDNSEKNVVVGNSISTNKKDNTSKEKDDDDENVSNTNKVKNESNTNKTKNETNTNTVRNESNTNTNTNTVKNETNTNKVRNEVDYENDMLAGLEKSTFNSKFTKYKGMQSGRNVSSFVTSLEANSKTQDEEKYLPYIIYINSDGEYFEETTDVDTINDDIGEIKDTNRYYVTMAENEETGLIHGIVISYNSNDEIKEDVDNLAKKIANK